MFALSDADLRLRILGCADGPASFNAEATRRGTAVISVDPLYRWDTRTIRDRIAMTYEQILDQTQRNTHQFVWDTIRSVEELGRMRMEAMQEFLGDYDLGKREGRYVEATLPTLVFPDKFFDLAVCSHFLFLYITQSTCLKPSIGPQFSNCAASPLRLGFSRYLRWMVVPHHMSQASWTISATLMKSRSKPCRTNFSEVGTR
jgi:hypothetical protein